MTTLSIQPSFREVIEDVRSGTLSEDTFWINFIASSDLDDGEAHEEIITVKKQGEDIQFINDSVKFTQVNGLFKVVYNNETFVLRAPKVIHPTPHTTITSLDVTPDETTYITGLDSGTMTITPFTSTSESTLEIPSAHASTITHSRFFPSGKVVISAGLDYQLKIWDATTGECPREFMGHKGRITSMAMIERGRNFVTGSMDGTCKLWDCASGNCIATMQRAMSIKDGVTAVFIGEGQTEMTRTLSSFEVGTLGKRVYAGHESGVVTVFDLGSREELTNLKSLGSPVVEICGDADSIYVAYESGVVAHWDIKDKTKPLHETSVGAPVNSMCLCGDELVVSYNTGFVVSLTPTLEKKYTLVGHGDDCKLVRSTGKSIYLASDSTIYKY